MHIRPAELNDIQPLVTLGKQLLEMHSEFDNDYYQLEENFDELFASWLKGQIATPSYFLLVAEEINPEKRLIGFISGFIKTLYPWFRHKSVGHIAYMIVATEFRRKGVGKSLYLAAETWFRGKNISYVELYTDEKNIPGQKAWFSYGFLTFKKFLRKKI